MFSPFASVVQGPKRSSPGSRSGCPPDNSAAVMWRSPSWGESPPGAGPRRRGSPESIRFPCCSPWLVWMCPWLIFHFINKHQVVVLGMKALERRTAAGSSRSREPPGRAASGGQGGAQAFGRAAGKRGQEPTGPAFAAGRALHGFVCIGCKHEAFELLSTVIAFVLVDGHGFLLVGPHESHMRLLSREPWGSKTFQKRSAVEACGIWLKKRPAGDIMPPRKGPKSNRPTSRSS